MSAPEITAHTQPTICLMLKAPLPGQVKTRLAATVGNEQALRVYRHLVEHQLRMLPFAAPTVIAYAPATDITEDLMRTWLEPLAPGADYIPQTEGDLTPRLSAALAHVFKTGAPAALFLGADCPQIDSRIIRKVRVALWPQAFDEPGAPADVVLIPATDGGYCLLATQVNDPRIFERVTWSTNRACEDTVAAITAAGLTHKLLAPLEDVDDEPSWERALAKVPGLRKGL